jgi:hypothetical protein
MITSSSYLNFPILSLMFTRLETLFLSHKKGEKNRASLPLFLRAEAISSRSLPPPLVRAPGSYRFLLRRFQL